MVITHFCDSMKISFIIIGRNEGWKLTKSIQSVKDSIEYNNLNDYEIIYVDSNSIDDSIDRANKSNKINILKLTGDLNAAIARNVGAKEAKGEVLFFIDGDMEIKPEFLRIVYSEEDGLIDDFVSGNWINIFYDQEGKFLKKEKFKEMKNDTIEKVTGGLFLIRKNVWELEKGMNEKFRISEDIDLGLRLAKRNIFLRRKKEIAANHHTISYKNKIRMWKDLLSGNSLYARSLLYRENIFNPYVYQRLLRNDYTLLVLLLILVSFLLLKNNTLLLVLFYLTIIVIKSKSKPKFILYYIIRDLSSLLGIFFFFPNEPKFKSV